MFARILITVAWLGSAAMIRAGETDDLRLIAPDGNAGWRLTGDLRRNADRFLFSPEYEIVNQLSLADADADPVLRHAIIRPSRKSSWSNVELQDGLLVFVWLVDQTPVAVLSVPSFKRKGSAGKFAAVATIPLTASTARGAPAVLLWKKGRFIPPQPRFRNKAANAALAAMHFGSFDDFRTALAGLRDLDIQAENTAAPTTERSATHFFHEILRTKEAPVMPSRDPSAPSLLYFAAEGGFTNAVKALLTSGANAGLNGAAWGSLHAAASNGRHATLLLLLANEPKDEWTLLQGMSPFDAAISNGHAAAASALTSGSSAAEVSEILRMAVALGDETAIRELRGKGAGAAMAGLPMNLLARQMRRDDPQLIQALLDAGLSAEATVRDTPLLVLAAASGHVECAEVLLRAGAAIEAPAAGGITALMTATTLGNSAMVEFLLAAGAQIDSVDSEGRTALHHAVLASNLELLSSLLEHRGMPDAADHQGVTPLHLALAMQSRSMVDALVEHGARLDAKDATNPEVMLQIMAVDAVVLLMQAAADRGDFNTVLLHRWPVAQVAEIFEAGRCAAWLNSQIASSSPAAVAIVKGDTPAVAVAGKNPAEPRAGDDFFPADEVKIAGIVSADGEFLFPPHPRVWGQAHRIGRLEGCIDLAFPPSHQPGGGRGITRRDRHSFPGSGPQNLRVHGPRICTDDRIHFSRSPGSFHLDGRPRRDLRLRALGCRHARRGSRRPARRDSNHPGGPAPLRRCGRGRDQALPVYPWHRGRQTSANADDVDVSPGRILRDRPASKGINPAEPTPRSSSHPAKRVPSS